MLILQSSDWEEKANGILVSKNLVGCVSYEISLQSRKISEQKKDKKFFDKGKKFFLQFFLPFFPLSKKNLF